MGMAYLLMLIVYIGLSVGIYKFAMKFTDKKWIKGSLVAFFILLPTYDIIIGNALKFYYCKFTELEKINRMIERPEVVLLQNEQRFDKYEYAVNEAESYLKDVKAIQIQTQNDGVLHEFRAKEYTRPIKLENVIEINRTLISKPEYIVIEKPVAFSWFVDKFLFGYGVQIIDVKTNKIIAWSNRINHQKYNFDVFFGLRSKSCGGTSSGRQLFEKIMQRDSK